MQTKTYFASSVPAALEVARKELGADAMLVNSRPSPPEVRSFGRLEVTFAFDPKPEVRPDSGRLFAPGVPPAIPLPTPASGVSPAVNPILNAIRDSTVGGPGASSDRNRYSRSEIDELREQIAALRAEVGQTGNIAPPPPVFAEYFSAATVALDDHGLLAGRLSANGLDLGTARDIAMAAARHPGEREAALVQELTSRIPVKPFAEMKAGESRSVAFIGPAGRGKTTSLVKIAVKYGLAKRIPVRIYSAGAHGVGCQEQMARYASLLGVPFQACESLESLHLILNGDGWKGLVLIDTPGISPAETEEIDALANFFSRLPEIEKHLVLRADARTPDMIHMIARFSAIAPSRLLFTGLDEAIGSGAMIETLIRSGIPAVFAGTGPRIPDDLEEIKASKLASELCGANRLNTAAAA